jgi:glycosyltransferase involved in cell wall biosynthesis
LNVALVIGPCLPGECGVGDYTVRLGSALGGAGIHVQVITSGNWELPDASKVTRSLVAGKFDIVHIEYPTAGFGYKLGPQVLSLLRRCVVTIHEASQRRLLRKISMIPFAIRPEHLIFTTEYERHFVTSWAPWTSRHSSVIPVGSNIEPISIEVARNVNEILYFGLVVPRRELEQVIELASLIRSAGLPQVVRVIGRVPAQHESYYKTLRERARGLPVLWDRDLSEEQIALKLAETAIAYLPYGDGATERRTTLKAACLSGLAVVTTRGPHTPHDLDRAVKYCGNPREALNAIISLIENQEEREKVSLQAVQYGKRFNWEQIAERHLEVYNSVLRTRAI